MLTKLYDDSYHYYLARNSTTSAGHDLTMPAMAGLDAVFQRYGWDYWTYISQPQYLMEELGMVWRAEAEADKVERSRNAGKTGGVGAVPADTPDLLNQARGAGMPLPPPGTAQPTQYETDIPDGEVPR